MADVVEFSFYLLYLSILFCLTLPAMMFPIELVRQKVGLLQYEGSISRMHKGQLKMIDVLVINVDKRSY